MIDVSIIIPTFNRNESLNQCISSILESSINNIEIIVVNDYKGGEVILSPKNKSPMLKIVNNPKQGVASARNYGVKYASSNSYIFVDDDMLLNRKAITKALDFLNNSIHATYNANWVYKTELIDQISKTQFGRYLIYNNFTSLKGWNNNTIEWIENGLIKADGITSQFFAIKKEDFELVSGYNENFPFAGFEDYEMHIKMDEKNILNYIDTEVLIFHNEIDRMNIISWLERQKRGAQTRKVAVNLGFTELKIDYQFKKNISYFFLSFFKKGIIFSLKFIPNKSYFDSIYFKIVNVLLGTYIYDGYCSIK